MLIGIMITFIAMNPVAIWKQCIHCSMVPLTSDRIANSTRTGRNRSSATFTWPHCIKRPAWEWFHPWHWKINPARVKPFNKHWYTEIIRNQDMCHITINMLIVSNMWTNSISIYYASGFGTALDCIRYYTRMLAILFHRRSVRHAI